jgi:putative flippase GtrA
MEALLRMLGSKRQFLLYCVIGATGAGLDFCVFTLIVKLAGADHYQAANAAGYATGTIVSFSANAWLNFGTRDRLVVRFMAFCGVALLGWATAALLLALCIGQMGWNVYLAKFATLLGVLLVQYNLNRWLAFQKTK